MKKIVIAATLALLTTPTFAADDHYVRPHSNRDGTYTPGHYQTDPNASRMDNYGTQGNTNPHTGNQGTVNPYTTPYPVQDPSNVPRGSGRNKGGL